MAAMRDRLPDVAVAHLVERIALVPSGVRVRTWTLRDDNQQHHHGVVAVRESPLYLRLRWRRSATRPVYDVGTFRLHLRALLAEDYIRPEEADGDDERVRVRFFRADDRRICIQWRGGMPVLPVGTAPAG